MVSKMSYEFVKPTVKTDQGQVPDTPPDFRVDRTLAGEHFYLSSSRDVGHWASPDKQTILITFLQFSTVVPQEFVDWNHRGDVLQLVKAYWIEHLIEDKLLSSNSTPTLLRYYSQRLMKRRYERAQLEVKLYGDAIAKDGLHILESGKPNRCDTSNIMQIHQCSSGQDGGHWGIR
jgi:hypothetical protein